MLLPLIAINAIINASIILSWLNLGWEHSNTYVKLVNLESAVASIHSSIVALYACICVQLKSDCKVTVK